MYGCVLTPPATAVRFPSLSLSDMQQRAFTNPHCRTERAWLCILIREGEGDRQTDSEGERERGEQGAKNTEMKAKKAPPPPIPTLSRRLHLCSELVIPPGRVGYSSSVYTKGFSFPGFPLLREGRGGASGGRWLQAVRWCSRGSQLCFLDNGIDCF